MSISIHRLTQRLFLYVLGCRRLSFPRHGRHACTKYKIPRRYIRLKQHKKVVCFCLSVIEHKKMQVYAFDLNYESNRFELFISLLKSGYRI